MVVSDIFLSLVDDEETFNPVVHNRRDLAVQDVKLRKTDENSFWSAEVEIKNPAGGMFRPGAKRRAIISVRNALTGGIQHVLTGRIQAVPFGLVGDIVTLTIVAAAKTSVREQLEDEALDGIEDDPWALFRRGDLTERRTPAERLSARPALLNYGRRDSNPPVLTDIIEGVGYLDLGGKFEAGTLRLTQPNSAVTKVEVTLSAEWLQAFLILTNVGNLMSGGGQFEMLGYPNWESFPRLGEKIGDWSVVRSVMQQASLNFDPVEYNVSRSANPTLDTDTNPNHTLTLARTAYDLDLVVAAIATARRKETVSFTVSWNGTPLGDDEGLTEKLDLSCSNLQGRYQLPEHVAGFNYGIGAQVSADGLLWRCTAQHISGASIYTDLQFWEPLLVNTADPIGGSFAPVFFGTGTVIQQIGLSGQLQSIIRPVVPGLSAIQYALNQARAKILKTMRSVTATFDVPWHYVKDLHGSERIRIASTSIPGGEMTGKVVSIEASLVEQMATVTIAAAPGKGTANGDLGIPVYAVSGLGNAGAVRAEIVNDRAQQQQIISQTLASDPETNIEQLINAIATRLEVDMSPVPRGGNLEVTIPMGTVLVDCDTMIDLEAAE